MKKLILVLFFLGLLTPFVGKAASSVCPGLLNHEIETIDGKKINLCQYAGKTILVVNIATNDSFTRQLRALQDLYLEYKDKGFVVLGFPTDSFGTAAELSNQDIKKYCSRHYAVTFPLFAKSSLDRKKGDNVFFMNLYKKIGLRPQWNFYKYFINKNGLSEKGFDSSTSPKDPRVIKMIEQLVSS